jgi:hypothetical protein
MLYLVLDAEGYPQKDCQQHNAGERQREGQRPRTA